VVAGSECRVVEELRIGTDLLVLTAGLARGRRGLSLERLSRRLGGRRLGGTKVLPAPQPSACRTDEAVPSRRSMQGTRW
jgi:hypothetical protein